MQQRGYSLIELILVIAITASFSAVFLPHIQYTIGRTHVEDATLTTLSLVRHAQRLSMTSHRAHAHGVQCLTDTVVSFEGSSYEDRILSSDTIYSLPPLVSRTSTDQIVFENGDVMPSIPSILTLTTNNHAQSIVVSTAGVVTRE